MYGWLSICTAGWVYVRLAEYMYGWLSICTAGWVYVRLAEYMYGWLSICTAGWVYVRLEADGYTLFSWEQSRGVLDTTGNSDTSWLSNDKLIYTRYKKLYVYSLWSHWDIFIFLATPVIFLVIPVIFLVTPNAYFFVYILWHLRYFNDKTAFSVLINIKRR